jgi:hypothetical protein
MIVFDCAAFGQLDSLQAAHKKRRDGDPGSHSNEIPSCGKLSNARVAHLLNYSSRVGLIRRQNCDTVLVNDLQVAACPNKQIRASTYAAYPAINSHVGPSAPHADNTTDQRHAGSHHRLSFYGNAVSGLCPRTRSDPAAVVDM